MNLPGKAFPDFNAELFENFTWDGLALIKRDSTNFVNESAVTGGNPILAFDKDSSKVLLEDMLGSSVGSVENGKFNAIDRSAFGESNSDRELNFFTGKPQVEGLGYSFLFRNYRAEQGKWQTSDPIGYPDGWNNLAYVNNGVNTRVDPLGLCTNIYADLWDPISNQFVHAKIGETPCGSESLVSTTQSAWILFGATVTIPCHTGISGSLSPQSASVTYSASYTYEGVTLGISFSGTSVSPTINLPSYDCGKNLNAHPGSKEYSLEYCVVTEIYKWTYTCGKSPTYRTVSHVTWSAVCTRTTACE